MGEEGKLQLSLCVVAAAWSEGLQDLLLRRIVRFVDEEPALRTCVRFQRAEECIAGLRAYRLSPLLVGEQLWTNQIHQIRWGRVHQLSHEETHAFLRKSVALGAERHEDQPVQGKIILTVKPLSDLLNRIAVHLLVVLNRLARWVLHNQADRAYFHAVHVLREVQRDVAERVMLLLRLGLPERGRREHGKRGRGNHRRFG
mmetsp:Transcript_25382/g.63896  ORF Transcript_25382/g.63896 Transcript_25382/m.63896 type:complete len:200 (+) Transcript_25382:1491-2090(+)